MEASADTAAMPATETYDMKWY